jgi:hypothetical protein
MNKMIRLNFKNLTTKVLFLCLFLAAASTHAQDVVVTPVQYPKALANPLMGFRPNLNNAGNPTYPFPRIVRDYIKWSEIESNAGDGAQKIIDFCNTRWAKLPGLNVKVIPRIYIDWDKKDGNEFWPADILSSTGLAASDAALWRTQIVKDRIKKLIYKLGQAWNNDPRVAWVQTGIVGYWGEQENPVGVDEEGYAKLLGDAFAAAFPNKRLVVRNQPDWDTQGHKFGVYWDSYGHPGQRSGAWTKIINTNAAGRYLTEVIEGEVAYNWGVSSLDPLYGREPEITLNNYKFTNNLIDVIRELHCTGLGWIASYDLDGSFGSNPDSVRANADRIQKEFGYRFLLPEFTCSARANQGGTLNVGFKVKNVGSAPFYENWQVAFVLIDESTKQIVWKEVLPGIDVRSWHPGSNYNYTSRVYQTPALVYSYNKTITIPNTVVTGRYLAGITILEPSTQKPGVFFAVPNFFKESQTQPLCRIGIGADATNNLLTGVMFSNLVTDDARYYNLTP